MPVLPRRLANISPDRILPTRQQSYHLIRTVSHFPTTLVKRASAIWTKRQSGGQVVAIPTQYQGINDGPAPGAVAGIILGSVAGFLLLIWLLWIVSQGSGFILSSTLQEEDVVVRRRSRSRGTRRSSRRTEMTSRSPRRDRVIRQERIIRESVPPRDRSRVRETVLVEERLPERRVDGDDIVEVIEEHSSIGVPPPRRKNRKSGGYR